MIAFKKSIRKYRVYANDYQNEAKIYMQMAVFLLNNCKFQGCGRGFQTLADLIHHIEDCHIDADPKQLEKQETQQPSSLALSYILKHFTKGVPIKKEAVDSLGRKKVKTAVKPPTIVRSSTPTGSEHEDEMCSEEDDSDQEYTTQEEFTTDLILRMMQNLKDGDVEKPFACPVPGCKKRYKNVNGMKYHARHGHRKDTGLFLRVKKAFKCKCGKCYRTAQALRNHMITTHSTTDLLKQHSTPRASTPSTGTVSPQVSTSPVITNAIFSVPSNVAQSVQSVLATTDLTTSGLSLVPVTVTKSKQGQIPPPTTLQLLSCPQAELKAVSQDMAND